MLRTNAQAGAEFVGPYAARTTNVCSKAYAGFSCETPLARCGLLNTGPRRLHFARLSFTQSRVPPADEATSRENGAGLQRFAHIAARNLYCRGCCEYKLRRALSMIARERLLRNPLHPRGNRKVHAVGVRKPSRTLFAKKILVCIRVHRNIRTYNRMYLSAARDLPLAYSKSTRPKILIARLPFATNFDKH